ncbi:MAG TPA: hypothetical protein VNJ01_13875 [Bacteriovoracaceae bacterium]|nr:hypothetical protein [Bacteriovoracaceae bacterium]
MKILFLFCMLSVPAAYAQRSVSQFDLKCKVQLPDDNQNQTTTIKIYTNENFCGNGSGPYKVFGIFDNGIEDYLVQGQKSFSSRYAGTKYTLTQTFEGKKVSRISFIIDYAYGAERDSYEPVKASGTFVEYEDGRKRSEKIDLICEVSTAVLDCE